MRDDVARFLVESIQIHNDGVDDEEGESGEEV